MRSLLLVLVILLLLSYVPPVRSGVNQYVSGLFSSCWRFKGACRITCLRNENYHILCDAKHLCCITKKVLPPLIGK
ncbi:beta-defensin 135 [Pipistrellus kuhlii]|uniref:Beta-defensin n=1 Tax=Pipistrellus kuhlii TaxID=59472 RepID=A0A7J7X9N7_PIPKU|nr:beta-defensin 135 [Pipistrellus kuhlii]KAF6346409.1 defensin beta 135 [Pipistrellus kuhlii]